MRRITAICLAALLGGCLSDRPEGMEKHFPTEIQKKQTRVYYCPSSQKRITLRFEKNRLWLFSPEGTYSFDSHCDPLEGMTCRNKEGIVLRFDRETASLKTPKIQLSDCRWDPKASVWEAAKLDGVDFRAIGEEPPWILEIRGARVDFYFGYEKRRYRFPHTRIETENNRTVMESKEFKAVLTPGPCRDSMSGKTFETAVWIEWGGRRLHGCGRALH